MTDRSESAAAPEPPAAHAARDGVAPALRTVAGLTVVSRFSGLARDAVCSRIFGAGPVWSAFAFAFLLPNLFRRLFGEGALSAAFLPEYARLMDEDPEAARRYASATIGLLVLILAAATLLGELLLIGLLFGTSLGETGGLALRLSMVTIPFMPLVCATALLGAMLQCHGRFGPPAAAPILVNLAIVIAAGVWTLGLDADLETTIYAVAASILVAGALQIAWALAALGSRHGGWAWRPSGVGPLLKRTFRRMAPVALGMSALQINTLLDGLIASWPVLIGATIRLPAALGGTTAYPLDEAANSVLFFAQRLYHFPLGVFGIALATAAFPALSRAARDDELFMETLRRGLRLSFFIGAPASIGLIAVRTPLVEVIYRGGAFSADASARVSDVLLGYAPGVWAFALTHVLTRAFYARGDTATPVKISLIAIGANFILNIVLIWWLREAALAWSTTICAVGQCVALAWIGSRRWSGSLLDRPARASFGFVLINSSLMAIPLAAISLWGPATETWLGRAAELMVLVLIGGGVYTLAAAAQRRPELSWLLERKQPVREDGLLND